jgi:hypothetical protein
VPVKLGFIILSIIGVLRIPEEFYLYKDKDKGGTGVLNMEVGICDNDLWWWRLLPVV